jgi:nickel/cobalt transporter (NicO) family protein
VEPAAIVLLAGAVTAAALHALIPDHWLPFVLMGRSRGWSLGKTLALASAGGVLHVVLAVGIGLLTWLVGREGAAALARRLGETLGVLSSLGLALFGVLYGAYSWRRERRHHGGSIADGGAAGADPHHHHGHLLERWFGSDLSGWSLVVVIGVSPCALAFPILLASAARLGMGGVLLVAGGFGAATMIVTLTVTLIAFLSARHVDFPFLNRYGDLISGVLIGLVGALLFAGEVKGW